MWRESGLFAAMAPRLGLSGALAPRAPRNQVVAGVPVLLGAGLATGARKGSGCQRGELT